MTISIIDSHVHLWPESAATSTSHPWMQLGDQLAKQYGIENYLMSTTPQAQKSTVKGFVYIETDRRVVQEYQGDVTKWAAEPLSEIAFLRRIIEGRPSGQEGFDANNAMLLEGIVPWAPLHRPLHDFLRYITRAKEVAGDRTWQRIKGFRYLVQGIRDEKAFQELMGPASSSFVELLQFLGRRGLSFDVGVDQRQGGVWQLEHFAEAIERTHKGVQPSDKTIFILNHLCKPNMEQDPGETDHTQQDFERWKNAISRMSKQEKVYMKLSGAFSELADQDPDNPLDVDMIVTRMEPWIDHVFREFGPWRVMFGSDWPVCNVRGPGDEKSWGLWVEVVARILDSRKLSDMEKNRVWHGTAIEAYRLEVRV